MLSRRILERVVLGPARSSSSWWTGESFSVVRALFGIYLAWHFACLIPFGEEVLSSAGVFPDASLSPLTRVFPNILAVWDSPLGVTCVLSAAVVLSLMVALGARRRLAALVLWYVWACVLGRNPLIINPGIPYVGWMLLMMALMPSGERGSLDARRLGAEASTSWRFAPIMFGVAWAVLAIGYTYSGVMTLGSPSWVDGTALWHVLESPIARDVPWRAWLVSCPGALKVLTWGTLALEIAAAPLALTHRTRAWSWFAFMGLHAGILLTVSFTDLTLGMVMIHLVTFDPRWVTQDHTGDR